MFAKGAAFEIPQQNTSSNIHCVICTVCVRLCVVHTLCFTERCSVDSCESVCITPVCQNLIEKGTTTEHIEMSTYLLTSSPFTQQIKAVAILYSLTQSLVYPSPISSFTATVLLEAGQSSHTGETEFLIDEEKEYGQQNDKDAHR